MQHALTNARHHSCTVVIGGMTSCIYNAYTTAVVAREKTWSALHQLMHGLQRLVSAQIYRVDELGWPRVSNARGTNSYPLRTMSVYLVHLSSAALFAVVALALHDSSR